LNRLAYGSVAKVFRDYSDCMYVHRKANARKLEMLALFILPPATSPVEFWNIRIASTKAIDHEDNSTAKSII